jgi:inorganic pyrophosphatase/exopolyphosphatase
VNFSPGVLVHRRRGDMGNELSRMSWQPRSKRIPAQKSRLSTAHVMIQEPTPKVSKAFEAQQAVTSGFRFRRGSVLRKKPTGKPTGTEGADAVLTESLLAKEVHARQAQAHAVVVNMRAAPTAGVGKVYAYIPAQLENAVFCGHLVTDLDSIAGALGAACLYGGTPARASEVNSETAFALDLWGVNPPEQIESIVASMPDVGICLVDHQQKSQLNPSIAMDKIVGIIDHHALQSQTIVTDKPIYIDIRPWGSMSTIIAHQFMVLSIRPEVHLAGMLLCAILSDTLNLLGPTTTEWDRTMVALLAEICAIDDVQGLAQRQFKAKSKELGTLSANQLVNGDLKEFVVECHGETVKVGFAVIETTDDEVTPARPPDTPHDPTAPLRPPLSLSPLSF